MSGIGKHSGKMLRAERAVERIRAILREDVSAAERIDRIAAVVARVRAPVPKKRSRCNVTFFAIPSVRCYRVPGHEGAHTDGTYRWPGTSLAANANAFSGG